MPHGKAKGTYNVAFTVTIVSQAMRVIQSTKRVPSVKHNRQKPGGTSGFRIPRGDAGQTNKRALLEKRRASSPTTTYLSSISAKRGSGVQPQRWRLTSQRLKTDVWASGPSQRPQLNQLSLFIVEDTAEPRY